MKYVVAQNILPLCAFPCVHTFIEESVYDKKKKETATYWRAYHPRILQCSRDYCCSTTISVLRRLHLLFTTMVSFVCLFVFCSSLRASFQTRNGEIHVYVQYFSFCKKNTVTHTRHVNISSSQFWSCLSPAPRQRIFYDESDGYVLTCNRYVAGSPTAAMTFFSQAISNLTHHACFASVLQRIKTRGVSDLCVWLKSVDKTVVWLLKGSYKTATHDLVHSNFKRSLVYSSTDQLICGGRCQARTSETVHILPCGGEMFIQASKPNK